MFETARLFKPLTRVTRSAALGMTTDRFGEGLLAARAREGDSRAFRTIFDKHAPGVRRFVRDLLRDEAAADEATQETFVRAHRKMSTIRDGDKLVPWLLGIARHVCFEARRARAKQAGASDSEILAAQPDVSPSPEAALLGREADKVLAGALGTLAEERRAALILRLDHRLSYDEIAEAMGWTLAKVKNEIHRARLELREKLGEYL
jgi:RNA polymerase sigma-70 factor (ECF subfamily)